MNHYFDLKPGSELSFRKLKGHFRGYEVSFFTASGIFASKTLDEGTQTLIDFMHINKEDLVLDLGCGNGIVGLIASTLTKNKVVLTDINERAILVSTMNKKILQRENVEVVHGDQYSSVQGHLFDVIVLNPPQTAGKKLCFSLIEQALHYLKQQGSLQVVCRTQKGGKSFEQKMQEVFGNVIVIGRRKGYSVYLSRKV